MKNVLFISGTRADFGKIKSLIKVISADYTVHVFVTGMHMLKKYGLTYKEIEKEGFNNIYKYINHIDGETMDRILAKTVLGLSDYVHENRPDMIVVHGDRVEALAGAIVGSLNNIIVSHIEGGELSGTVDELVRHSISKLSHLHFVSNSDASQRLIKMGEASEYIYEIGSPDIDIMASSTLPSIEQVKERYEISFSDYGVVILHPVTTELEGIYEKTDSFMRALEKSGKQWVVIMPNNDHGSDQIVNVYKKYRDKEGFKFYPSMRFEFFLTLLKNSGLIIGNSSCGIREAPFYGIPSVNVGTRQAGRVRSESVKDAGFDEEELKSKIDELFGRRFDCCHGYGDGKSTERFYRAMLNGHIWCTEIQKKFCD